MRKECDLPQGTQPTILIADDDPHLRLALRERLQSWGYRVIEGYDGLGALTKALGFGVDALILDHDMPVGKGQEIAGFIRKSISAPIIFLSGHAREEFRDTILKTPDSYYLAKPLDADKLRNLLATLIATPQVEIASC